MKLLILLTVLGSSVIALSLIFGVGAIRTIAGMNPKLNEDVLVQKLHEDVAAPSSLAYGFKKIVEENHRTEVAANRSVAALADVTMALPFEQYMAALDQNPEAALPTIRRDLERTGSGALTSPMRSSLLQAAGNLASKHPGKAAEVREIALREMLANVVQESHASLEQHAGAVSFASDFDSRAAEDRFLVAVAHSVFMANTPNVPEALGGTIEAVVGQNSSVVRNTLVNQFVSHHPDQRAEVLKILSDRGISVEVSAQ